MTPLNRPLKGVHSHIVFVEDDGVTLATYGLLLVIRGRDIRLTELPASTRVIVLSGFGASITVAAMHICVSKHIEVLITSPRYGIMTMFVPSPVIDANRVGLKVRHKQFEAVHDPVKTVAVARSIISEKIKAEGHARSVERALLAELRTARTTDNVRHLEAKAAQVWWKQWAGFEMRQGRLGELTAQFTARRAIHPLQAMLNYAIGIAAARMTRVVAASGMDPCFGFLHDGRKPGRLSLVWDCVEPLRPAIVKEVFEFVGGRVFRKGDFAVSTEGVVRLTGQMARKLQGSQSESSRSDDI